MKTCQNSSVKNINSTFGDIDAFIRHNFMIFVISKCKIKGILMLKLLFGAKFRLRKF